MGQLANVKKPQSGSQRTKEVRDRGKIRHGTRALPDGLGPGTTPPKGAPKRQQAAQEQEHYHDDHRSAASWAREARVGREGSIASRACGN